MLKKTTFMWSKYSKTVILWKIWQFKDITPVLSVTWSYKNDSNMLICCSRNIYLLFISLNVIFFVETDTMFQDTLMNEKNQKNSIYLK